MPSRAIISGLEEKIHSCREQQFTGLIKVNDQHECQWFIYYLLGRIVWIKARTHPLRRWQRHLAVHSPVFFEQISQSAGYSYESWNYAALSRLVKLKQFRRDQFSKVVESCIIENIFDILQVGTLQNAQHGKNLTYETQPREAASLPFVMLQQESVWQEAQQEWHVWEQAGLTKFFPDWAPAITQLEALKAQTPPQTFQTLATFVDGQNTLRDLANKFQQPIIPLTKSLLPYISRSMLRLAEIPDLIENASDGFDAELLKTQKTVTQPTPIATISADQHKVNHNSSQNFLAQPSTGQPKSTAHPGKKARSTSPQIIYIDDSPADSRAMCKIVEDLGYQYANIPDPLQALPLLIEYKPKLIFLDLVMPIANGYEVCAQIRRISALKEIPVVIVTSNDGI
ncbi:MAG: response regulator, partial [Phormidesmis sp.]